MPDSGDETWRVGERTIRVSHLDKLYWPQDGLTKGDLLAYYRAVAPVMLPHLAGRPVTLRVYPEGIGGDSFYRRDLPDDAPDWLRRTDYAIQSGARTIQLPLIDDAASLIWLGNQGCIEVHVWSAHLPALNEPDQAVFDLDPGDEATFGNVLQAALRLREALTRSNLRPYPKTSGRRGLHVHLPLASGYQFEAVRAWVKEMATRLAQAHPELIVVAHGATHKGTKIAIDYAQNSVARTMAAPYTVRAAPGAPVAAPLRWEEIAAGRIRPMDITLRTMPSRLQTVGDPFAGVLHDRQRLPI